MNFPKIIPFWLFRTIGITMLLVSFLGMLYFMFTFSGPYEFFSELFTDDNNTYPPVLAALLTLLVLLLPCLVVALILRPFANVPKLKNQLGTFTSKFTSNVDTTQFGELPSVVSRIIAFIIDRFLVIMIVALPAGIFIAFTEQSHQHGAPYYVLMVIMILFIFTGVIYSYSRDMFGGKSIARRLLKQKVVDMNTGKPIGGWRSFKRELIMHFAPLILIELILISSNKDRRRMGDSWAKTIVIKDPKS